MAIMVIADLSLKCPDSIKRISSLIPKFACHPKLVDIISLSSIHQSFTMRSEGVYPRRENSNHCSSVTNLYADIDECLLMGASACGIAGQICVNTEGSFTCTCPPGSAFVDGACQGMCTLHVCGWIYTMHTVIGATLSESYCVVVN